MKIFAIKDGHCNVVPTQSPTLTPSHHWKTSTFIKSSHTNPTNTCFTPKEHPFQTKCLQFPIKLAYAMTFNGAQRQSLQKYYPPVSGHMVNYMWEFHIVEIITNVKITEPRSG